MNRKEYIGNKIAEARKKNRLTQKYVSEITGIDKTTISKIEKGKINATIDTIDKLCEAVGATLRVKEYYKIFEDLVFEKHDFHKLADAMGESYPNYKESKTCYQAKIDFENGLHCSVVIGTPFYSNGVDTYEVCLYSEGGFELVQGYLNDFDIDSLMMYAQMVKDVRTLELLQEYGFEHYKTFRFTKKVGEWYVVIHPCGKPHLLYNNKPQNYPISNMVFVNLEELEYILPNLEGLIYEREKNENKPFLYLLG